MPITRDEFERLEGPGTVEKTPGKKITPHTVKLKESPKVCERCNVPMKEYDFKNASNRYFRCPQCNIVIMEPIR